MAIVKRMGNVTTNDKDRPTEDLKILSAQVF